MSKGQHTRQLILAHAAQQASRIGLDGLSIGQLAGDLQLSKSGLFAHFRSKEELQIQVLETISAQFSAEVIRPALKAPRGVARLEALFEHWRHWAAGNQERDGCPFVAASMELDDRHGPVREALVAIQTRWIEVLERTVRLGQESGSLASSRSPAEVAQALQGIMLAFHFYHRLLRDPDAENRARHNFAHLLQSLVHEEDSRP